MIHGNTEESTAGLTRSSTIILHKAFLVKNHRRAGKDTGRDGTELARGHITRMTLKELQQELALHLFQRGKLSFGKAREMAGMPVWAFQQLLGSQEIPVHYDVADYDEDLDTLKELGWL